MPTIKFNYIGKYAYDVCERPRPSKEFIPQWHKDMPTYDRNPVCPSGDRLSVYNRATNVTGKKCIPMLDGITEGYTVPLWADINVEQTPQGPYLGWTVDMDVFSVHGSSYPGLPAPPGFHPMVFKYMPYFRIETPPGYSVFIRPPAGHYDLPIQVIPATVDTDKSVIDSNFPCWIKSGFQGVIKKGTPIAQVIPFKRDNWSSEVSMISDEDFNHQLNRDFLTSLKDNYINKFWSRKKYE
jgi:hypothetical protein